ncbi:MAG TPA: hypothetical protein VFF26_09175 [Gallionella sp.]|nr:hypothetical protein [Gallionella sp.]
MKQQIAYALAAAAMLVSSGVALAEGPWRHAGKTGMRQFVVVTPAVSTDVAALKQAAGKVCAAGKPCVILFWPEGEAVPTKMPMTYGQKQTVVAQYSRNPATGSEELLLRCQAGQTGGQKCLR